MTDFPTPHDPAGANLWGPQLIDAITERFALAASIEGSAPGTIIRDTWDGVGTYTRPTDRTDICIELEMPEGTEPPGKVTSPAVNGQYQGDRVAFVYEDA